MWRLTRRDRREERLNRAVARMETLANDLEEHNRLLANLSPTVGLYETFQVNTGRGVVDVVLCDLELQEGPDGRLDVLGGRVMARELFDQMMTTPAAIVAPISGSA